MLLSIGMIVKNEEKNLDKCLTAMRPILENVDSELIIADTGSADNTVEIAKKHTDNVFYFEWINDFAAARNSTLQRAKGEWFMYVDADEIFTDCTPIIEFFNSGEYKKYNAGTFVQRNYTTKSGDRYGDFNAPRLSKIFPETRFELPVHEGYNIFKDPIKILPAVADHYGYIHDDDENTAKKKRDRNIPLLLKRLEEEENPRSLLFMQLFEATFDEDEEKALEYLDRGLELSKHDGSCMLPAFYNKKVMSAANMKDYEKAVEYCDEFLNIKDRSIKPDITGSDGEMSGFKAHILECMGKYSEAVTEYIRFFRLYKDYCKGKLDTNDLLMYELHYLPKDRFYISHREFLRCCINAKKYNTALEYLKLLPIDKCPEDGGFIYERIRNEVIVAENTGFKNLASLFEQLSGKYRDYFYRYTRARIFNVENKKEYVQKLLKLSGSEEFKADLEIIGAYLSGDDRLFDMITDFAGKYGAVNYPELLYILIAEGKDILPVAKCGDFEADKLSFSCCGDYEGFYKNLTAYDMDVCSEECCEAMASIIRTAIVKAEEEKISAVDLLTAYGKVGMRLCGNEDDEELSKDIRGALMAAGIVSCFEKRDLKGCIAYMRKLLKLFPEFKAVISDYQQVIKDAAGIGNAQKEAQSMASMAVIVKRNINEMLRNGNLEGAENTLAELSKLVPGDPELITLKEKIDACRQ